MNEFLSKNRREKQGFTAVELLVVFAIIALLVTIVSVNSRTCEFGADAGPWATAQIKNFKTGIVAYKMKYDKMPEKLEDLAPFMDPPEIPKDPWGNDFQYKIDGDDFEITCFGADGRPGGEGSDRDLSSKEIRK